MISRGRSKKAALKIYRKTYVDEFPFNTVERIQSTAYYWIVLQTYFGSAQKEMDVGQFLKFQKKSKLSLFL